MQLLITRDDIAQYRQISKTPHNDKLNEQILDAQMVDVAPLLGEKLYNKVIANPGQYSDLLNGSTYEHKGTTYTNYGLKMVLCYYAYARYIMFSSVTDTPFSVVEKLNDNSRSVEATTKKAVYSLNRDAAFSIWQNVHNFLIRTQNQDFNSHCSIQNNTGFRLTKIQ